MSRGARGPAADGASGPDHSGPDHGGGDRQRDPDEPLPELFANGHQSLLAKWIGKTPREIAVSQSTKLGVDSTGTIDHVAGMMQKILEEVGGDGWTAVQARYRPAAMLRPGSLPGFPTRRIGQN